MPSIIDSDDGAVSGTSGLKTTGGNDGILVFQKNGTETARINTDSQIVTVVGTASLPPIAPTGDLNTGIYFPGADRVGFTTGGSQRGEFDASGNFQFNSGYGSVATAYGCRAWVNFNGTGTVAIRASGNVSSITDNGTGDYTVNFTTAMPDANYSASAAVNGNPAFTPAAVAIDYGRTPNAIVAPTTTAFRFSAFRASDGGVVSDWEYSNVAIFR